MKLRENIVKGWIASLVGIATIILTLYKLRFSSMTFVWEGIAGLSFGVILVLAPQSVEGFFIQLITRFQPPSFPAAPPPPPPQPKVSPKVSGKPAKDDTDQLDKPE